MSFNQLLMILKSRYKILFTVLLVTVITSVSYTLLTPKKYKATTSVLVNYKGVDPVSGVMIPAQLMIGYISTQIDIIKSPKVAKKVVADIGITKNQIAVDQFEEATKGKGDINTWYANLLLQNLDVIPSKESSLIYIVFEGNDPEFASLVSNSFAKNYIKANIELKVEPAKKAAIFLKEQISELKSNLEEAQSKLSRYQKEFGLTSLNGSIDVEVTRLGDLSTQLVVAQGQLYDSNSRKNNNSPDVELNPLVQNLRVAMSLTEAKLAEISSKYGASHPQYKAISAELLKQRKQLNSAISKSKRSIGVSSKIAKDRVQEIKQALNKQKDKLLRLNLSRDKLSVLQTEVLNANQALANASNRFNQVSQDSSANQSDVTILNEATPPIIPTSPNVVLNIILSIFSGLILGMFSTIIAELPNKKVRSKEDVLNIIDGPVFAIISNKNKNKSKNISHRRKRIKNPIGGLLSGQ